MTAAFDNAWKAQCRWYSRRERSFNEEERCRAGIAAQASAVAARIGDCKCYCRPIKRRHASQHGDAQRSWKSHDHRCPAGRTTARRRRQFRCPPPGSRGCRPKAGVRGDCAASRQLRPRWRRARLPTRAAVQRSRRGAHPRPQGSSRRRAPHSRDCAPGSPTDQALDHGCLSDDRRGGRRRRLDAAAPWAARRAVSDTHSARTRTSGEAEEE